MAQCIESINSLQLDHIFTNLSKYLFFVAVCYKSILIYFEMQLVRSSVITDND